MKKFQGDPSRYRRTLKYLKLKKKLKNGIIFSCATFLTLVIFHDPILLSHERWLSFNENEFSGKADVLFFMDVNCTEVEEAARRVSNNEAEVLYAFIYDDVDYRACRIAYDNAIIKHNIRDRAYWGNVSYTTMGATKKFSSTMSNNNIKSEKILFTTVNFAIRRSYWSIKHNMGDGVKLNTYNSPYYLSIKTDKWWESPPSKDWIFGETQKMLGYWWYYGLLGRQEEYNVQEKDLPFKS